ncbi:unnamed protein product [Cylicocyclus nassatus]|uniref:Uncharacterized protein n=1 Tax=Cylicocyclus nassatus TaxID=53992 RepID=A0AA36H9A1_CYLNA|nr:unnamed protein product [Cylicocyclus nassatus]
MLKSNTRLTANEVVINGGPTPDSGKYETEAWIERIVVQDLERTPSSVSIIRSSDPTAKLEFLYERD